MLLPKLNDYALYCLVRANYCSASCDNDCVWHNESLTSTVMLPVTLCFILLLYQRVVLLLLIYTNCSIEHKES